MRGIADRSIFRLTLLREGQFANPRLLRIKPGVKNNLAPILISALLCHLARTGPIFRKYHHNKRKNEWRSVGLDFLKLDPKSCALRGQILAASRLGVAAHHDMCHVPLLVAQDVVSTTASQREHYRHHQNSIRWNLPEKASSSPRGCSGRSLA